MTKTFTLTICFDSYMRSHESAFIKVTSPTNKSIYIYKKHFKFFTDAEKGVYTKMLNDATTFTADEMHLLLQMSQIAYFATKR